MLDFSSRVGSRLMPPRAQGYNPQSLDDLYFERDAVPWWWRVTALAASWMILGGYLLVPTLLDSSPSLRFPTPILSILLVSLLALGHSLTLLLRLTVHSLLFHAEAIFLPSLCSSSLGLLGTLWALGTSTRYTFSRTAAVGVALAGTGTTVYGSLLLHVNRRIAHIRRLGRAATSPGAGEDRGGFAPLDPHAGEGGPRQDPNYYKNWVLNMHPTAAKALRPGFAGAAGGAECPTEEDAMRMQMAGLLARGEPAPSPEAGQDTFRIEWPGDGEDGDMGRPREEGARAGAEMLEPGRNGGGRSGSGVSSVGECPGGARADSDSSRNGSFWSRLSGNGGEGRDGRGRSSGGALGAAGGTSQVRAKSREDRRREIEMGSLRGDAARDSRSSQNSLYAP